MKCCIIFTFLFSLNLSANVYSQKNLVSLDMSDVSVEQFVRAIKRQTSLKFMYNSSLIRQVGTVSVKVKNKELKDVLDMVLSKVDLEHEFFNNVILIRRKDEAKSVQQQKNVVRGTVKDEKGETLPGVTVLIKGEKMGASTDVDGKYSIAIPGHLKEVILSFSYIGMVSVEVKYTGQDSINVVLKEEAEKIDEVVVNGYFTRKKESYTGVSTTFSGSELRKVSTGNVLNMLSMLDPSFTKVVNNEMGSDPNTIPNFEIRGSSSLKGNFKGTPNMPTFIMDGFEVTAERVFDLDPHRIRFITILKDAAATAIYGSRAANGVVVIETEAPKLGRLQLSYNASVDFEIADLSDYSLMNAKEKLEYEVSAGLFKIESKPEWTDDTFDAYNQKLKFVKEGNDVDWLAIPVRELGIGHKHSAIAEGGFESFRYALDLSYSNKVGVMKGSKRDAYGGGVRLQYNLKKLKFTNYLSFDHVKSVNSPYGSFNAYLAYNPYYNPYDEDGNVKKLLYSYRYYDEGFKDKKMYNELYNAVLPSKNQSESNRFLNNFAIEYDIIQGLKLRTGLSLSIDNGKADVYKSFENTEFVDTEKKGSYSQSLYNNFSYDINAVLTYFKLFKKHSLNAGLIYNLRETKIDRTDVLALGFPNAKMDHISMGVGYQTGGKPGGAYDITRLVGFVGNLGYTYDDRFLLDFSIRSDGSSLYGANNRWGTFWSLGVGYNLHKEKFMEQNLAFINLLKIRGSIGTTGGQNFSTYQSLAVYSYNDDRINNISYSSYLGAILKAFGNKNLKWQKVEKRNIGFDFELFDRRFTGSFNVYNDISKDVLVDVTLPPSLGFPVYKENLGKVQNSGVELTLKGTLIRDMEREIYWNVVYNLAHNKNKVMKINKALTAFNDKQDSEVKNKPMVRYKEGLSQNTIWANESLGIDPATGEEIFLDMNGNKVNAWSTANYKPMGTTDPKIYGTIGSMFTYKRWEFNAHLYYKYGGYLYNSTLVDKIENVNPNENGDKRILYDRWKKQGDVAKYKKVSDVSVTNPTSRFIEKENYIQLQSLSVTYDFSCDKLKGMGIQRLKLSAIGNDIFTSSTVRMERGTSYPFARTFSFLAQLTF